MTDYTQLIEQLRAPDNALCNAGAKAIEALQARCVELTSVAEHGEIREQKIKKEFERVCGERDAALAKLRELENLTAAQQASNLKLVAALNESEAKLRELEAKPSPTALELMREYSNGKQWALEEAAKICDSTPPHPFRPSIEAEWAIRKLGEGL